MGKEMKLGIGDQKLYSTYDKSLTGRLEGRLASVDVQEHMDHYDYRNISLLKGRYFKNDGEGKVVEDVPQMFGRIASNIAYADKAYGSNDEEVYRSAETFYKMMISTDFIPNSPTIMNAGRELQQLSACFVLPIKDSMESILGTMKNAGMVHKTGGGTGFDLSEMRMANDFVSTTYGLSSGPVRFLGAYDSTTHAVNQGGTRRGANMGMMRIDYPDIIQFINEKTVEGKCNNFNLSVSITDKFMKQVENDGWYTLVNPKKGERNPVFKKDIERIMSSVNIGKVRLGDTNYKLDQKGDPIENIAGLNARFNEKDELQLKAREVFDYIIQSAWKLGEPGVVFIDTVNKTNPTPNLGEIKATNPCGEQPLLPYEACNLGSINLSRFVKNGCFDYDRLRQTVRDSVHFLDNVVDMSKFPLEEITEMVHKTRKIGLGVMGWADALIDMKIPYDSKHAIKLAEDVMGFINQVAEEKSRELAESRGSFPAYRGSIYDDGRGMRNATRTTIAPTGSISKIAGFCSSSIEPIFEVLFTAKDADGNKRKIMSPTFERDLRFYGFEDADIQRVINELSDKENPKCLEQIEGIPEDITKIYRTTRDVSVEYHIMMQAAFQKYTDNAVSKTINLPFEATTEDVKEAYLRAFRTGCKGVTIYRDKSRKDQILIRGEGKLEGKIESVTFQDVELGSKAIEDGHDSAYYKISREDDTFHLNIVGEFWEDPSNGSVYLLPSKIFQNKKPLGNENSNEFAQAGLDRTGRLKSIDPDYAGMIKEWKSVTGDRIKGMGPNRINSPSHGVGLAFEHYCLQRGLVTYNEKQELKNAVDKQNLMRVKDKEKIKRLMKSIKTTNGERLEHRIYDNIDENFECPVCHCTTFHKEAGCSDSICDDCTWSKGTCD